MKTFTKLAASAVAASTLLFGFAGAASAQSTTTTTTVAPVKGCKNVEARIDRLQKAKTSLETRIDRLQKALVKARSAHHDKVVERLEHRLDRTQRNHDRVVDRIAKIRERCTKR